MTKAARSVYVFGMYLLVLGSILTGAPNTLLVLVGLPTTNEPWVHVLGIVVMAIGILDVTSARAEQTKFFRATVAERLFVFAGFVVLALFKMAPPIIIAFGLVDVAGAVWTFLALRDTGVNAGAV